MERVKATRTSTKISIMEKFKCCSISINKPLIPLKLALFCYYGIGAFMTSFLTLLLKQRGITLSELSAMTVFAPIMQITGTSVSGVIADKIGRPKPVLAANLLLVTIIVIGILLMPSINHKHNINLLKTSSCNYEDIRKARLETNCNNIGKFVEGNYSMFCSRNLTTSSTKSNQMSCEKLMSDSTENNLSFMIMINNNSYLNQTKEKCFYSTESIVYKGNITICDDSANFYCFECCSSDNPELKCFEEKSSSNGILIAYAVLYIFFLQFYSTTYRCFDMTVMSVVKEYNSDFGHERFFSIMGNMCWSPIAGLLAHATTKEGEEKNYNSPMYLFIAVSFFLQLVIYKLPVVRTIPAGNMWKKSFKLLKSVDVLMFLVAIFTLGTSFNFTKYYTFWYLDELGASSVLIGLITSVSALYGLPFLLTSKWWLKKLGTHQIFVISLLAYVFCCLGYSFLKNPWIALVIELHGAMSYYLLWVAVVEHSHSIAPEGLTSTIIGVAGAIHYSAGRTSSSLIGGIVMSEFGGIMAFRLLAIICFSVALLYTLFYFSRRKCISKKRRMYQKGGSKENSKACVILTLEDKK